jgi:hypothetical protein
MFGSPVAVESDEAVFNLVWSYGIKAVDARKKAWCTCDGSTRLGQVRILDETYANCVDQTSACLFYGIARLKTSLFMVLMCQMRLRRLLPLNKDFTSILIGLFTNGGLFIRNVHQFLMAT